jgi:hypothetical protein
VVLLKSVFGKQKIRAIYSVDDILSKGQQIELVANLSPTDPSIKPTYDISQIQYFFSFQPNNSGSYDLTDSEMALKNYLNNIDGITLHNGAQHMRCLSGATSALSQQQTSSPVN